MNFAWMKPIYFKYFIIELEFISILWLSLESTAIREMDQLKPNTEIMRNDRRESTLKIG